MSEIRIWHYVLSCLLGLQCHSWEPGECAVSTCVQPSANLKKRMAQSSLLYDCWIIDFSNGTLCQLLTTTVENVMNWEELQCNAAFVNHLILIFSAAESEINASGSRDKESFMCSLSSSLTLSPVNVVWNICFYRIHVRTEFTEWEQNFSINCKVRMTKSSF